MPDQQKNIIEQLKRDILSLQGYKPAPPDSVIHLGLGQVEKAFPGGDFPRGAIHDFINTNEEQQAATTAFIAGILGKFMQQGGISVWIGAPGTTFAPGLAAYGVDPDRILFVTPRNGREALWVMEEALHCASFVAVVGELAVLTTIESRRFQLAVEQSRVSGFLLRHPGRQRHPVASVAQWRITAVPSQSQGVRPGRGFPRWRVELLKVRNGRPGCWEMEWQGNKFYPIEENAARFSDGSTKTG